MFYKTYLVLRSPFLLPAATKLGQGNVFTGVCGSVNVGGSASVHAGIPTQWEQTPPKSRHHLGPDQTPLGPDPPDQTPQEQTPPLGLDQTPPGPDPPGADTPPPGPDPPRIRHPPGTRPPREQTPQKQTPPREADSRIRSTSGR